MKSQVKEWPRHKCRPRNLSFLLLQIFHRLLLPLEKLRQYSHSLLIPRITAKLTRHEALYARFDRGIDHPLLQPHARSCNG